MSHYQVHATIWSVCAHKSISQTHRNCAETEEEPTYLVAVESDAHWGRPEMTFWVKSGWCADCERHYEPHNVRTERAVRNYWSYKAAQGWAWPVRPGLVPADVLLGPPADPARELLRPRFECLALADAIREECRRWWWWCAKLQDNEAELVRVVGFACDASLRDWLGSVPRALPPPPGRSQEPSPPRHHPLEMVASAGTTPLVATTSSKRSRRQGHHGRSVRFRVPDSSNDSEEGESGRDRGEVVSFLLRDEPPTPFYSSPSTPWATEMACFAAVQPRCYCPTSARQSCVTCRSRIRNEEQCNAPFF